MSSSSSSSSSSSRANSTAIRVAVIGGVALAVTTASIIGWRHWAKKRNDASPVDASATVAETTITTTTLSTSPPSPPPITTTTTASAIAPSVIAAPAPSVPVAVAAPIPTVPVATPAPAVDLVSTTTVVETKTSSITVTPTIVAKVPRRVMYIMRGVPGSGKSTLAKQILEQASSVGDGDTGAIFSTDDFFAQSGTYRFNPKLLGNAHQWNFERTQAALLANRSPIIIDNSKISHIFACLHQLMIMA
jgi:NEDD4-binding protein 2